MRLRNLCRLLWINAGLDLLHVAAGFVLLYTMGAQNPFAAGDGWGVVIQGSFLFVFDYCAFPRRASANRMENFGLALNARLTIHYHQENHNATSIA